LVFVKTRKAKTNSLKVAEFFKKPHDRLLENIRKLTLENVRVKSMFKKSIYINSRGREMKTKIDCDINWKLDLILLD